MTKKWFPLTLIVLGLIIVGFGLIYALYSRNIENITPVPLPNDLAGLTLRREAEGSAALTELSMMHNQGFRLNK